MKQDLDKLIEETAKRYDVKLIDKTNSPIIVGLLNWGHYKSIKSIEEDLEKLQQKGATHIYFIESDEDELDIVGYRENQ